MNKKSIKSKYLKNPHFCPKCGGVDIEDGEWNGELQQVEVSCNDCGAVWMRYSIWLTFLFWGMTEGVV